jgi:hypothetical protein
MNYEEEDEEQLQHQQLQKQLLKAAICIQRGFRSAPSACQCARRLPVTRHAADRTVTSACSSS